MELREMTAADLFVVADMERRLFSDPWSVDAFRGALHSNNQIFIVLDDEGTIAGYCGMMCVPDEGQILNIAVDEPYRRHGLATELMKAMLGFGIENGMSLFTLEVRAGNTPAINLYRNCGFVPVGVRKGYYHHPTEDAILMDLDLLDPEVAARFRIDDDGE